MIKKLFLTATFILITTAAFAQHSDMALVKSGKYLPLYGDIDAYVEVSDFYIDTIAVTKAKYLEFLRENPQWRKSNVKGIFADDSYLSSWPEDLDYGDGHPDEPVTNISWFAAKEYCKYQGKRLPTLDEWEYAAMADEKTRDAREKVSYNQYILSWYERPKRGNEIVGSTFKNVWGIYDLHGLIWEWTQDFNSVMIASESRSGGNDTNLFCSAAAVGATDLMNYAAFMRYAYRSSIKGNNTGNNLGFRCAKDGN